MATETTTVFQDPQHYTYKHPLETGWTLWFDNAQKKATQQSWSQNLKKVTTISTVEDFWGVYNNITKATQLALGANYHFFREGVEPAWEDPMNAKGGKWLFQLAKGKRDGATVSLDSMWMNTLLGCVGEILGEQVCGVVLSVRKAQDRIAIWTRDSKDSEACEKIGRMWKELAEIPADIKIGYQSHDDAAKGHGTEDLYTA